MAKEIWVFAELNHGSIASVTGELLAKSQKIASQMDGYCVAAVVAAGDAEGVAGKLGELGAEKVYVLEHAFSAPC